MLATVMVTAGKFSSLAAEIAGQWAAATLHPFINDVDPGETAVVADFTPATFVGSTAQAIGAWGEAFLNARGNAESVAPVLQWDYDSGPVETIYGFYILSAAGGTPLIAYCRLETPVEMGGTSNSVAVVPRLEASGDGIGAFATVSE